MRRAIAQNRKRSTSRTVSVVWIALTVGTSLLVPGAGFLVAAASFLPTRQTTRRVSIVLFVIAAGVLGAQLVGLSSGSTLELGPATSV